MNTKELATRVYDALFPVSLECFASDYEKHPDENVRAVWRVVRPLVEKEAKILVSNPEDKDLQAYFRVVLNERLKNRFEVMGELESALTQIPGKEQVSERPKPLDPSELRGKYSQLFQHDSPFYFLVTSNVTDQSKAGYQISHIDEELKEFREWAVLALWFGRGLAIVTIVVLILLVIHDVFMPQKFEGWQDWLPHAVPRIIFVVIIQFFSYVYFSMAKSNLSRVQYLVNEKTNIETKLYALRVALTLEEVELSKSILLELAKTERNFILDKDKTTIELEKMKNDVELLKSFSSATEYFGSFVDKIKGR